MCGFVPGEGRPLPGGRHISTTMPKLCIFCLEERPGVRLYCGHMTTCLNCAPKLRSHCSICRSPIVASESGGMGYESDSGETFKGSESVGNLDSFCFKVGCPKKPIMKFQCVACCERPHSSTDWVPGIKAYRLCADCAARWFCIWCYHRPKPSEFVALDAQPDDGPFFTNGFTGRSGEACYNCKHNDARYVLTCPCSRTARFMLCRACSVIFTCTECGKRASQSNVATDSDCSD